MIALAKRKEKEWNFLIADTCMLPFKTNAFSAIVAVGLTESINDIDKWLQEIIGVLKSGGKIIFTFAPNIFTNWMRYIWNPVLNLRSEPFWLEICKNYGLRLIAKDKTLFQAQFLLVKEST
jgi:ubiquinone/menaquinone biosynthesis C-methylase UbiE